MDNLVAFLRHLHVDATILPLAPADDLGRRITRRTADEVHSCLLCGERAGEAFVVDYAPDRDNPDDTGKRWLDLCQSHGYDVRKANELPEEG